MYGPEEYLGIQALLSNESYNETTEATEDTSICLIPKDTVEDVLNKYADVGRQFIRILSNNLVEKEEQLLQLAYHSVRKRMAQTLLKLASQSESHKTLRVSREDLAAMAGMATETVSRTLSDFKEEGIIEKKGSQIDILDVIKLQKMKN
jgi:CRP-like cAMP-binding protein